MSLRSRRVLLAAALVLIAGAQVRRRLTAERIEVTEASLAEVLPQARAFERRGCLYLGKAWAQGNEPVGAAVLTSRVDPKVGGYVDEIGVLVGLSRDGKVQGVKLIHHKEHKAYMRMTLESGLLGKLVAWNVTDPFPKVDAVTGATVTSVALLKDVESAGRAAGQAMGLKVPESPRPTVLQALRDQWKTLLCIVTLALGTLASLKSEKRWLTLASWALGFLGLGLVLGSPFSVLNLTNLIQGNLPAVTNPIPLVLLIFVIVTSLLMGRTYCGFICPFGGLQEVCYKTVPWRAQISPRVQRVGRYLPLATLVGAVAATLLDLSQEHITNFEPYFYLFSPVRPVRMWTFVVGVLVFSTVVKRAWCRFFCPCGAASGRRSPLRLALVVSLYGGMGLLAGLLADRVSMKELGSKATRPDFIASLEALELILAAARITMALRLSDRPRLRGVRGWADEILSVAIAWPCPLSLLVSVAVAGTFLLKAPGLTGLAAGCLLGLLWMAALLGSYAVLNRLCFDDAKLSKSLAFAGLLLAVLVLTCPMTLAGPSEEVRSPVTYPWVQTTGALLALCSIAFVSFLFRRLNRPRLSDHLGRSLDYERLD